MGLIAQPSQVTSYTWCLHRTKVFQSLCESLEKTTVLIHPGHVWGDVELPYCNLLAGAEVPILVQGPALALCAGWVGDNCTLSARWMSPCTSSLSSCGKATCTATSTVSQFIFLGFYFLSQPGNQTEGNKTNSSHQDLFFCQVHPSSSRPLGWGSGSSWCWRRRSLQVGWVGSRLAWQQVTFSFDQAADICMLLQHKVLLRLTTVPFLMSTWP